MNFSNFCLGTAQFGQKYGLSNLRNKIIQESEIEQILNFYHANGGMYIDTAQSYGKSEKLISKYINNESRLISKVHVKKNDPELLEKVKVSLENLSIEALDTLLIHNPEIIKKDIGILDQFIEIKKLKMTRNIGISIYSFDDLGKNYNEILSNIDVIQIPGNALDKRFMEKFNEKKINLPNLRLDIRSIFLQGALLQPAKKLLEIFPNFSDNIKNWSDYCNDNNLTQLEACLYNLPKFQSNKNIYLFGCRTKIEIEEILKSLVNLKRSYKAFSDKVPESFLDPRKW